MNSLALLALLIGCAALPARAQDHPVLELFQGFSYLNQDLVGNRKNFFGFGNSIGINLKPWFGFLGDFAGQYGELSGFTIQNYEFMGGPRLVKRGEKADLSFHALVGGATLSSPFGSETAFAAAAGFAVDLNMGERMALRIVQADFLHTRFFTDTQQNVRIGFGFVFKVGGT